MTRKQVLELHGYVFVIRASLTHGSYVTTPDGWIWYAKCKDIHADDYESVATAEMVEKADAHYEKVTYGVDDD